VSFLFLSFFSRRFSFDENFLTKTKLQKFQKKTNPTNRAMLMLVSPYSSFISGQTIEVTGGAFI